MTFSGAGQQTEVASLVETLENMRNFIDSLGWIDEGSVSQAEAIVDELPALAARLIFASSRTIRNDQRNN